MHPVSPRHGLSRALVRLLIASTLVVGLPLLGPRAEAAGASPTPPTPEVGINLGLGVPPPAVVRSTPATTWQVLLALGREDRFDAAAHLLDLGEVPAAKQRVVGAAVAEKLYAVLHHLGARPNSVAAAEGQPGDTAAEAVEAIAAFRFERSGIVGIVWLRQVLDSSTGERAWLVAPQTVAAAPFWYRVIVVGEKPVAAEPLNRGLGVAPQDVQRGTPRAALAGYFAACNQGRFALAAHYLDLGDVPAAEQRRQGAVLARRLHLALLRSVWIELDNVSDNPLGSPEVEVGEEGERVTEVRVNRHVFPIVLEHRWDAEIGHQWTFSRPTVAAVNRLYAANGYGWLGDHLPLVFFVFNFAGLQLWQWLAVIAALAVGWVFSRVMGRWLVALAGKLTRRTSVAWDDVALTAINGPVGFVLWASVLALLAPWFGLSPSAREVAKLLWKLLILFGFGWFLLRLVDGVVAHLRRQDGEQNQVGLGFLPVMTRFAKAFFAVLIVLGALDVFGLNVMGVLAGLGIGGIALAFAAQKTLENVFGAASIAGDRPFQVGDFVAIGQDQGTVEDVGLRSTRLRTLSRTVVTIPNGLVAAGRVENLSARERFLYNPTLGLVYGTTASQLRFLIDEIALLLTSNQRVWQENKRVRFRAFGQSALEVEVQCWIITSEFNEFLAIAEEINFAIMELVERAGTSFAFPSRTIYTAQDAAIDLERAAAAGSDVERRRSETPPADVDAPPRRRP
ncbi:MAG: mechanosensitive ion channel family protein [Acidobacteria bacterium]|nr:mechanosensitive ion channel family protein [Acidobacteriota bacterium]